MICTPFCVLAASSEPVNDVSSSKVPISEESVVQVEQVEQPLTYQVGGQVEEPVSQVKQAEQPLMYQVGVPVNEVEEPVSQVKQAEQPLMYQVDDEGVVVDDSSKPEVLAVDESTVSMIEEPVSQVEQVEQPLMYQFDESVPAGETKVIEEPVTQVEQAEETPLTYNFDMEAETKTIQHPPSSEVTTTPNREKQREEEVVAVVNKDPGWYKQMFQQFQNTVEEQLPGGQCERVRCTSYCYLANV